MNYIRVAWADLRGGYTKVHYTADGVRTLCRHGLIPFGREKRTTGEICWFCQKKLDRQRIAQEIKERWDARAWLP